MRFGSSACAGWLCAPTILWLGLLVGCSVDGDGSPLGAASQEIIGGAADSDDPAVVVLIAQAPGAESSTLCTGEIISPHVVLTAAHCVSPVEVGVTAQFFVYPGADLSQANAKNVLQVRETHANPSWLSNNLTAGHDVGVAILTASTAIPPLPYNRTALTSAMKGQPVRLVGYGITAAGADASAGARRQVSAVLDDFDAVKIAVGDSAHGNCNGDSGGPALFKLGDAEAIIGVTSYGDTTCSMVGFDTRIDAEIAFIDGYVMANDPRPTMDGGAPADGATQPDGAPDGGPAGVDGAGASGRDGGTRGGRDAGMSSADAGPIEHRSPSADARAVGCSTDGAAAASGAPSLLLLGCGLVLARLAKVRRRPHAPLAAASRGQSPTDGAGAPDSLRNSLS
jgi:V8-like Glu-specific endopeptidase